MPPPSTSVDSRQLAGLHRCIRSQGLSLAKMGSARFRPHKDRGVEHHIFSRLPGAGSTVEPCLPPPQTSYATRPSGSSRSSDQVIAAPCSQSRRCRNARQLGDERDDDDMGVSAGEQLPHSCNDGRHPLRETNQCSARTVHELRSQVFVTPIADALIVALPAVQCGLG